MKMDIFRTADDRSLIGLYIVCIYARILVNSAGVVTKVEQKLGTRSIADVSPGKTKNLNTYHIHIHASPD